MSRSVVILQPQYIPWVGVFEQIQLADVYVHYDDVQYPQGRSFTNRVQIKTSNGPKWLSVPVKKTTGTKTINKVSINNEGSWRRKHIESFRHAYAKAPFIDDALGLMGDILSQPFDNLSDLNCYALETIARYLKLDTAFVRASELDISGNSTQRLVDICDHLNADKYITGLGARNYVQYSLFEDRNIELHYMLYEKRSYCQQYGEFTPYVSILDLIANCGVSGRANICSSAKYWQGVKDIDSL